ncbi:MAG: hypothetical protein WKF63_08855 [Thermomicrobiales bacterium]
MTSKNPPTSGKPWKPGDPLKFDKAIKQNTPGGPLADKLDRADDALFPPTRSTNRSVTPTNHKSFNRQKKG